MQVEGRFQCDEVQFRNGSTRIRVNDRCEVTTAADGVFMKGFEQTYMPVESMDVIADRSITRWRCYRRVRRRAHLLRRVLCPCLSCRLRGRLSCGAEVELVSL